MKDFENPIEAANHAFVQMKRIKENFNTDLSTIDGAISDLYHDLEEENGLNAYVGYLYARRFKDLYEERRKLKEQFEQVKSFERFFNLRTSIDNMDRAMLKINKEMPRTKRNTRKEDLLSKGSIRLKNGRSV